MNEIILFTSNDCLYCSIAEKKLKEVIDEYGDLFELKLKNVEHEDMEASVTVLPTIIIGKKKFEGVLEKDQIHTALFSS
ncbi:MAG: thioredoxin family protein [Candidatus Heimdallarchaeaceae archaeon]